MKAKKRYQFYSQQIPKKNKSQFISFLFRPSFGVKRTICFLILLPLPFPPRTAGLNSCCYDAQRRGCTTFARETIYFFITSILWKSIIFWYLHSGKCGVARATDRERSVQPMLCVVATPLYIYKLWAMDGEKFSTSFGHYHFTSFLFFAFLPLSFYLLILFLFCLYLLSSFLFLSLSFLSFILFFLK